MGIIEIISVSNESILKNSNQEFEYLFVLDFESTCWDLKDSDKQLPEIIEFSMVLYDVRANKVIDEFQQYVMPMEAPKLSDFCKSLTGKLVFSLLCIK